MNRTATDSPPNPPAASLRGQRAEQAIVEAVLQLLDEGNVGDLTVDKIATRARVGKPTIYRRWSSKAEVVAFALNSLVAAPPLESSSDLRDTLVCALRELRDRLTDTRHGRVWQKLLGSQEEYRDALDVYVTKYLIPRRAELTRIIQPHFVGSADKKAAETLVQVLVNAMLGAVLTPGGLDSAADPDVIVDTVLHARSGT